MKHVTTAETIGLDTARTLIDAARREAETRETRMNIAVVSHEGHLIAFEKMDGAWLASIDIAIDKAFTAVSLQTETASLAEATQPGGSLYGLNTTNDGRLVVFGGGIPLMRDGTVVGAIGVSGSTVEDDVAVARAGADAFSSGSADARDR